MNAERLPRRTAPHADPLIGKVIDDVEIIEFIDRGNMGSVYMGIDRKQFGIPVAFKTVVIDRRLPEAERRKRKDRFLLETDIAIHIRYPRIVGAYRRDYLEMEELDFGYMVMEYVEGESLADQLERAPGKGLPVDRVLRIAIEMCGALTHASAYNLVHRDVRPANILVDRYGLTRLCDFGIAKLRNIGGGRSSADTEENVDHESVSVGKTIKGFGDYPYVSPEQWKASEDIDHRSDIYSLGCTLYHLLVGKLPFRGPDRDQYEWQHTKDARPDPCLHNPEVPKELGQLIVKMMAIEPSKRVQSTKEVEDALRKITPPPPPGRKRWPPGLENLSDAQYAFVVSEIFGPPVSMRAGGHGGIPESP